MHKRWLLIVLTIIVALAGIFAWQVPTILKAMPSRYVARLPEPIQALGVREHVDALPTAAVSGDTMDVLRPAADMTTSTTVPITPAPPLAGTPGPESSTNEPTPTNTPTATSTPVPIPAQGRLTGIQHHFQTWNNCGPATMSMALTYFSVYHSQDETATVLKPDPEDRNVTPEEMAAYVRNQTEYDAINRADGDLNTLRRSLSSGFPVIIELGIDPPGEYAWMEWYGHYLLLVAYDDAQETFWVYDSWFGTSEVPGANADDQGRKISYDELDRYWRQFNRNYIILYPLEKSDIVSEIVGEEMDDEVMWRNAQQTTLIELNNEPDNAFLWFNLGTTYNALKDYERAAAAFDKARSIGLPWRMLWYQFGPYEAYYQMGRYEDVIVLADVTLQDRPYFEESYYYKALAQIELGNVEGARENLQKAVNFNPNFKPAAEALEELEIAIK